MSHQVFTTQIHVRWSDQDVYHHVNNAKMVTLLEEARIAFVLENPQVQQVINTGLVVADLSVHYKYQVRHTDSPLKIEVFISELRNVDFVLEYRVYPNWADADTKPAVIANTRLVSYDIAAGRISRLSPAHKEALGPYVVNP